MLMQPTIIISIKHILFMLYYIKVLLFRFEIAYGVAVVVYPIDNVVNIVVAHACAIAHTCLLDGVAVYISVGLSVAVRVGTACYQVGSPFGCNAPYAVVVRVGHIEVVLVLAAFLHILLVLDEVATLHEIRDRKSVV